MRTEEAKKAAEMGIVVVIWRKVDAEREREGDKLTHKTERERQGGGEGGGDQIVARTVTEDFDLIFTVSETLLSRTFNFLLDSLESFFLPLLYSLLLFINDYIKRSILDSLEFLKTPHIYFTLLFFFFVSCFEKYEI